ncbi:hypothetical protein CYMTET_42307 [Cymbomonas tetramitiformis]|uniref:Integrase catalytic domain-containing protein n=1 Tax=Cymbomonas tetramitiformis TaxID=36881 RepID=A0AAE0C4C6_9CHLO|nr:hypothetical protein CYMTET_42307 [Cymbomonas tetramitiformis]
MAFILRAHHLGNTVPKDIIPVIRTCLTCDLHNPPPAPKLVNAVKTTEAYREYSLDYTPFNEGNLAAVHGIWRGNGVHEGWLADTEKAYVVAQCIITSWSGKDPPTHIRCDNGRAFTAEIIQIICATVHVTMVFIQAGNPNQNGAIEVAHKPFIGIMTSLLIQDPNLSYADAISMAVNIKSDLVMPRSTTAQRSSITTSKLQGFAATGPYIIEAIVSKTSVRLVDRLWGKTFDRATSISMLTMFKARGESTLPQVYTSITRVILHVVLMHPPRPRTLNVFRVLHTLPPRLNAHHKTSR